MNDALTPLSNMGQILYEPPDVAGWDAGQVVVLDRRDAGAHEFRVDARRPTSSSTSRAAAKPRDASDAARRCCRSSLDALATAPLDDAVTGGAGATTCAPTGAWTGSDAQLQAKVAGPGRTSSPASPEYQFV